LSNANKTDSKNITAFTMTKISLETITESVLLTQEERKEIEALLSRKSSIALTKLMNLHDSIIDAAFGDAIRTSSQYLKAVQNSMEKATEYISEDRVEEVVIVPADEFNNGKVEQMHHSVAVMYNKLNAVPERMSNMQKTLFDASEELVTYFMLHKKYASPEDHENMAELTKFSYADISSSKKRKRI
jgi:hypothetical protein